MIMIELNTEVEDNTEYLTCQEGEFNEYDMVLCKHKEDVLDNTVKFYAIQIKKNITNESSN
jgi:hypothetical protein